MKLWLIEQSVNNGYDTYSAAVVAAQTMEEARVMAPGNYPISMTEEFWAQPKDVSVAYLGEAGVGITQGVVLANFRAG